MPNIFNALPNAASQEIFETLLQSGDVTIERITSLGQVTPPGQWLEDGRDEWVLLLKGTAELVFADQSRLPLQTGDYVHIPARTRHRVERTDPHQPSVWLAIYYGPWSPAQSAG